MLTQSDIDYVQRIYASWEPSYDGVLTTEYIRQVLTVSHIFGEFRSEVLSARRVDERESYQRLQVYLRQICTHPYWSRLWIVQEVHLARDGPRVIAGSLLLNDDILGILKEGALMYGKDVNEGLVAAAKKIDSFCKLIGRETHQFLDQSFKDGKVDSLVSILHRYCLQSCLEPRDRIFGLLGMLDPKLPTAQITVDYQVELWRLFLVVLDLILAERESNEVVAKKPILSWIRWLAWALDITSTDIIALLNDSSINGTPILDFKFASSQFLRYVEVYRHERLTTNIASYVFASCTFNIAISLPHTRMFTQSNEEISKPTSQTLTKETSSNVSTESLNYRFSMWLQGHFQPVWKHRTQTWVCQLDEDYCFPLAIQPQSSGIIRVLGYVAREEPGNGDSPWKLCLFPLEIANYFQNWFDKHLPEIKQRWLQLVCLQEYSLAIPMSMLQILQLSDSSPKDVHQGRHAEHLLTLIEKPNGVPT
jgi:hypothetical protein